MVTGIVIVAIFLVMAALMMAKKIPAVIALPIMAVAIAVAAGLPWTGKDGIFEFVITTGGLRLASTYVPVIFACWLSQILYRYGVTDTIVKKAAEFGGDKPFVIAIVMSAASIFLFTTLFGTGAVAMVGAVVLPILLSVGIPPIVAGNVFLAALAAGYNLNPTNIATITNITGIKPEVMTKAAFVLLAAGVIFIVLYLIWSFRKNGIKFAFSAPAGVMSAQEERPMVTGIRGFLACLTPLVVVLLAYFFKFPVMVVFLMGIIWAVVFSAKGKWANIMSTVVESFYQGFKEGAPAAALMIGIGMILNAMTAPVTQTVIGPFMKAITPTTAIGLIAFVCLLSPLGLYRGPFNLMGLGAGLAASMLAVGALPTAALSAVFYAAYRWPAQSCPTSTQVVWTANFVGHDPVTVTNPVQLANWVMTALSVIVLTLIYF